MYQMIRKGGIGERAEPISYLLVRAHFYVHPSDERKRALAGGRHTHCPSNGMLRCFAPEKGCRPFAASAAIPNIV